MITGLGIFEKLGWESAVVIVPTLLVLVATPFLANRLVNPVLRLVAHLVGVVAAVFSASAAAFALTFSIFTQRRPWGAGWIFLGVVVGCLVDALLRVVWSEKERQATRPNARD
jgi:phosphotransferase system  glucose/maltose/N-acetylglucosamine-specific IIC component